MVAPQESTALHELVIVDTTAAPALYILSVNSILARCVAL